MQSGPLDTSDVTSFTSSVLVNGVKRPVAGWNVSRGLKGDLPEQVVAGGGVSQAMGSIDWAQDDDISSAPATPWNKSSGWIPMQGDRVEILVSDGTSEWKQFVGIIDETSGDVKSGMSSSIVDRVDDLSRRVNLPALLAAMPPLEASGEFRQVGLSSLFYLNTALRRSGFYSSPAPEAGCVLDAPLQGSHYPLVGNVESCLPASGDSFTTVAAPWGSASQNVSAVYLPSVSRGGSVAVQLLMMRPPSHSGTAYLRAEYGPYSLEIRVSSSAITAMLSGVSVASLPLGEETIIQVLAKEGTVTLRTNDGRTASGAGALPGASVMTAIRVFADSAGSIGPVQVSHPTVAAHEFASLNFEPSASLRMGRINTGSEAMPAFTDATAASVIDEISLGTLRPFWIDETGVARIVASDLLFSASPVRTLTTLDDLQSLTWVSRALGVRSSVSAKYQVPIVTMRRDHAVEVWSQPNSVALSSGESESSIIEPPSDEDWVMVDDGLEFVGAMSFDRANRGIGSIAGGVYTDGVNEQYASLVTDVRIDASIQKMGASKWSYTATARPMPPTHQVELRTVSETHTGQTSLWPMWRGKNLPILRAKARTEWTERRTAGIQAAPYGAELELDFGPWVTGIGSGQAAAVEELAQFVADQVAKPQPEVQEARITYDPRLQLGDVVNVSSPNFLGIELTCLIVGTTVSAGSSYEHVLNLRVINAKSSGITYGDFAAAWNDTATYGSLATAWGALSTYADFNTDPLRGSS